MSPSPVAGSNVTFLPHMDRNVEVEGALVKVDLMWKQEKENLSPPRLRQCCEGLPAEPGTLCD